MPRSRPSAARARCSGRGVNLARSSGSAPGRPAVSSRSGAMRSPRRAVSRGTPAMKREVGAVPSGFPAVPREVGQCARDQRAVRSRYSGSAFPVLGQCAPGARAVCSRRSGSALPALGQCAAGAWAVLTTREQCSRQDSRALAGRLAGRDEERPSRCVRLLCPTLSSAGGEGGNRSVRRGRHFVSSAEEASARALLLPRRHPCRRSSSGSGPRPAPAG